MVFSVRKICAATLVKMTTVRRNSDVAFPQPTGNHNSLGLEYAKCLVANCAADTCTRRLMERIQSSQHRRKEYDKLWLSLTARDHLYPPPIDNDEEVKRETYMRGCFRGTICWPYFERLIKKWWSDDAYQFLLDRRVREWPCEPRIMTETVNALKTMQLDGNTMVINTSLLAKCETWTRVLCAWFNNAELLQECELHWKGRPACAEPLGWAYEFLTIVVPMHETDCDELLRGLRATHLLCVEPGEYGLVCEQFWKEVVVPTGQWLRRIYKVAEDTEFKLWAPTEYMDMTEVEQQTCIEHMMGRVVDEVQYNEHYKHMIPGALVDIARLLGYVDTRLGSYFWFDIAAAMEIHGTERLKSTSRESFYGLSWPLVKALFRKMVHPEAVDNRPGFVWINGVADQHVFIDCVRRIRGHLCEDRTYARRHYEQLCTNAARWQDDFAWVYDRDELADSVDKQRQELLTKLSETYAMEVHEIDRTINGTVTDAGVEVVQAGSTVTDAELDTVEFNIHSDRHHLVALTFLTCLYESVTRPDVYVVNERILTQGVGSILYGNIKSDTVLITSVVCMSSNRPLPVDYHQSPTFALEVGTVDWLCGLTGKNFEYMWAFVHMLPPSSIERFYAVYNMFKAENMTHFFPIAVRSVTCYYYERHVFEAMRKAIMLATYGREKTIEFENDCDDLIGGTYTTEKLIKEAIDKRPRGMSVQHVRTWLHPWINELHRGDMTYVHIAAQLFDHV